ncbi:hypothetical protein BX264_4604 [Streptomyces sp. 2333.5]|uniref:hypothetical protein n=1 Tax=unclassified Streptomyces TaxID=2593676 RepID=UPI00089BCBFC|nr:MULTISPECIES: hypothetical protein [unclassified Streptomyces]PJJ04200.1 hypothetical protein BX264_4604 [Streptomyces sp. 2333.5]SEE70887.1 hypothetical protein SAMN05428942_4705 [Streptomyces sp. 2112.2]
MSRSVRWSVAAVVAAVVFGVCLWGARSVSFGWMPEAEADRWVVATAFASVMTTVAAAAIGRWAGREQPGPSLPSGERTVLQRATASGRGRAEQIGGDQNAPFPAGAGSVPGRVEQDAEVSDDASVTQVSGDQHTRPGDDEQQPRP